MPSAWTLRETLIVAVLGAVFAVLYLGWVQLWLIAQAVFGAISMDVFMGFWFIASIVAAAIIRKPGVAFGAEVLAAAVQVLLGSPAGLLLIVTGMVQGAGAELVFALTRWRNYSLPVLMAAGIGAAVFSFVYTWIRFDYAALAPGLIVVMFVIRCLSGALLGGLLGYYVVEALYRTGVLHGLKIDDERRAALA
ncbi:ECF transporter S component [Aurantimonas sp. C2-6-R+9]|uniref:ECF transporter S component n=1 Tax=unclassified Aurantimonas TaxID=2638230 RepID=UPI002E1714B0|nr:MULTISPECIES: ECF transporter S component [unclassified Aurantimonas]MEC5293535.1 ECF transporter S component [Aurantimonas sp. C2-3-R2]MEC5383721.1 ECF transporter S component [Aurantimonas sp. C2-6-R+9]MEC5414609.1 ECF transporter S component [Aurantimonas sp. C2-4-R8]